MSGVSRLAVKGAENADNAQNNEEELRSSEAMRIP